MKKVSVIIRTKNEEKWISHCLKMVFKQDYKNFEVIIIDNQSTDNTLKIVKRFPISKLKKIKEFIPGKALNIGIKASKGDFFICLSSHCIPKDKYWLSNLIKPFELYGNELAAVYGRQIPMPFTNPVDKRDLLLVFGKDEKLQTNDYFFHNANSAIRKSIWEKNNFDNKATNMEDRIWAKKIIKKKYKIFYQPQAMVFHHHGLHQNNKTDRLNGIIKIINQTDTDSFNSLPETFNKDQLKITSIIPFSKKNPSVKELKLLKKLINELSLSIQKDDIYLVGLSKKISLSLKINFIDRKKIRIGRLESINMLLYKSLKYIEKQNKYPDYMIFSNYDYLNRPLEMFKELISLAISKGNDFTFSAFKDYGHYWRINSNEIIEPTDPLLLPREKMQNPTYKALYGLGSISATWLIRQKKMIGGKVGIYNIKSDKYTLRIRNE